MQYKKTIQSKTQSENQFEQQLKEEKATLIGRVIHYSDLFPEQVGNKPDVRELIKGISRENLCSITVNMMLRIVGKPFYEKSLDNCSGSYDYIRFFLSKENADFLQDVKLRYAMAKQHILSLQDIEMDVVATSKAAVLDFQRYFMSVNPSKQQEINALTEQNCFKALLLCNEKVLTAKFDPLIHKEDSLHLYLAYLYLAYNYANEDVDSSDWHDLFRRQFIKSITLFSFLYRSKDKRIKVLRGKFLSHFNIRYWIDYIIPHIMTIYIVERSNNLVVLKGSGKYIKMARRVIQKSCIDKDNIIPIEMNDDFKRFRSLPYIKIAKHQYSVTSLSFVIEHMYNSVYFELKNYCKDVGFKSEADFRRYYTTEFSQKYMFERYVKQLLSDRVAFSIAGSQCEELLKGKHEGKTTGIVPPDYYIRFPEGCLIFEFKDALTNAKIKESRDAEKLFAEIRKKFFENDEGNNKGVTQILDNVQAIQEKKFFFDSPSESSVIYPILVVDNPVYTMRGMHTVLESMMRNECHKRGLNSEIIKPLILMDVATLRLYSDFLRLHGLIQSFEDYYAYVTPYESTSIDVAFKTLISFSEYLKGNGVEQRDKVFDEIMRIAESTLRGYKK